MYYIFSPKSEYTAVVHIDRFSDHLSAIETKAKKRKMERKK